MTTHIIKSSEVFVPGGIPTYTYNPRKSKNIEDKLEDSATSFKLIVVTGPTKSGKTVLVNKIFPRGEALWIDGGSITSEDNFWEQVVSELGGYTEEQLEQGRELQCTLDGQFGANVAIAKAELTGAVSRTDKSTVIKTSHMTNKSKAITLLQNEKVPVVIDDFHYIEKSIQKKIVRALKAPIMYGVPVICIAIPNRKFDVIDVERELTRRMESIELPNWDVSELETIASDGFATLNCSIPEESIHQLATDAFGSPFLMQEFCHAVCRKLNISEQSKTPQVYICPFNFSEIYKGIAINSGRSMFDKLKRGPRTRTDRKQRHLKNGSSMDIYGLVMEALKNMKPGVETISYDTLRASIREIIDEDLPQRHEISRVLEQIADISYTDSSSTPVIDWQKDDDILTITDPFFAFFLKWSE